MRDLMIALGPEAPAFGSWQWIGADLCRELSGRGHSTAVFQYVVPDCDVAVFVKFKPSHDDLQRLRKRCRLIYCPVDLYGNAAEIDADAASLSCFDCVVIHCERLRKYFSPYAPVVYLDHHLKFIAEPSSTRNSAGPLLWIGNRSNLLPVVEWLNRHQLPGEVWLLTDFLSDAEILSAAQLGFQTASSIRVGRWTPERHCEWTSLCRVAFDVKGDDFRARHKPPTKALDFLASGVPLAMNGDSSSTEHLKAVYDVEIADLGDLDRWLSADYFAELERLAPRLRTELSRERIAERFLSIIASSCDSRCLPDH